MSGPEGPNCCMEYPFGSGAPSQQLLCAGGAKASRVGPLRPASEVQGGVPSEFSGALRARLSAEELQGELRLLVRLREDCGAGLLQNRESGQLGCFGCDVSVADTAFGGREVLACHHQVVDGDLEA